MQPTKLCRVFASIMLALAGCSPPPDNPFARIQNPPLVSAKLHTVTVVTPDAALPEHLAEEAGYEYRAFTQPNYPAIAAAEGALLKLPRESVASTAFLFPLQGHGPNVRIAFVADVKPVAPADENLETAFYRNVLGAGTPQWRGSQQLRNGARVQAYTYLVDDLLAAKRRLKEGGVQIMVEPLGITTAYLGTHQSLAIQAPDGTAIQLVQSMAH